MDKCGDNMIRRLDKEIEELYIGGRFKVKIGNKVVAKGRNKWTRYFASTIVEHVTHASVELSGFAGVHDDEIRCIAYYIDARVGRDTTTPTDPSMEDLVQKEDVAPSSRTRVIEKYKALTEYRATYLFEWDTGVLPSMTIGEFGVYGLVGDDSWSSPETNPNHYTVLEYARPYYVTLALNAGKRLMARMSSGDRDFDPIDYDNTKVLKLEWAVIVSG